LDKQGELTMPSNKPRVLIRTEQEIIDKLDVIAKEENRSRSKTIEYLIKNYIKKYEKENGEIEL
jgi:metal-responsive CopG/Arc/MetJ family transcriptional regulator